MLVDDHDLVRQGVASLLTIDPQISVVGQAASVAEGLALARSVAADVAIVDVSLGDGSGLDVVSDLRARHPGMGIVVLTMHRDDDTLLGALDAGASALMHKSQSAEEVMATVRQAHANPGGFSAVGLAEAIRRRNSAPRVQLTARELEVLQALAGGSSVAQAAKALFMSESTVKTHIAKLYDKLGANNRASAMMAAIRLGLISAPKR